MHAHEHLPDEMKVEGKAAIIFRVEVGSCGVPGAGVDPWNQVLSTVLCLQSVPSHCAVHREAESLLSVLQLPGFPPISSQILLHPARLSLRYLLDANLPGNGCKRCSASSCPHTRRPPACTSALTASLLLVQLSSTRCCAG